MDRYGSNLTCTRGLYDISGFNLANIKCHRFYRGFFFMPDGYQCTNISIPGEFGEIIIRF